MALLKAPGATRLAVLFWLFLPCPIGAQRLTQEEALSLAFPAAAIVERRTAYLEDPQLARISELAGGETEPPPRIVSYYVASDGGRPLGVAYFDAHRVRTLDQVLLVVVGADNRIRRVETVAFREPPEYEGPGRWLALFPGRDLDQGLSRKGDLPNITGATLTAEAVTRAVRRVLALHQVIAPFQTKDAP
jgi:hypothetical protein